MARSRSADTSKAKVIKQDPEIYSADSRKNARTKPAASKTRKTETNKPQNESGATAGQRKTGAEQTEAGEQMGFLRVGCFYSVVE